MGTERVLAKMLAPSEPDWKLRIGPAITASYFIVSIFVPAIRIRFKRTRGVSHWPLCGNPAPTDVRYKPNRRGRDRRSARSALLCPAWVAPPPRGSTTASMTLPCVGDGVGAFASEALSVRLLGAALRNS